MKMTCAFHIITRWKVMGFIRLVLFITSVAWWRGLVKVESDSLGSPTNPPRHLSFTSRPFFHWGQGIRRRGGRSESTGAVELSFLSASYDSLFYKVKLDIQSTCLVCKRSTRKVLLFSQVSQFQSTALKVHYSLAFEFQLSQKVSRYVIPFFMRLLILMHGCFSSSSVAAALNIWR